MPISINKPVLRNALRKLRRVSFDRDDPVNTDMAPQEILDFLAMLARIKPVCLIGRGFDDPDWVEGVREVAHAMKLNVVEGPRWFAEPEYAGFPDWYAEMNQTQRSERPVLYICKSRSVATEVQEVCASGAITVEQEARLLEYPPCCVRDHYRRDRMLNEAFMLMLHRTASGNEEEMKRIVREDVQMELKTEKERTLMGQATALRGVPFTSFYMCPECKQSRDSPTMRISRQYEKLAETVSPDFAAEITRIVTFHRG